MVRTRGLPLQLFACYPSFKHMGNMIAALTGLTGIKGCPVTGRRFPPLDPAPRTLPIGPVNSDTAD